MKKVVKVLFCLCMMFSLLACSDNTTDPAPTIPSRPVPSEKQPDCDALRQSVDENQYIAAVAFLGLYENGTFEGLNDYLLDKNLLITNPFFSEIKKEQFVETDGYELYCIVPVDPKAEVTVYKWIIDEHNDYQGESGDVLYHKTSGTPIFIRGNESDIMANMMVEIIDSNNRKIQYVPHMGLMDGYLSVPEENPTIYDFTEYSKVLPPEPFDLNILSDRGKWEVSFTSTNNDEITAYFYFNDSRHMTMSYGVNTKEPQVFYEGNYGIDYYSAVPVNAIYMHLELTKDNSNLEHPEIIFTYLTFVQRDFDMFIHADYYSEDRLFINDETNHFVFGF